MGEGCNRFAALHSNGENATVVHIMTIAADCLIGNVGFRLIATSAFASVHCASTRLQGLKNGSV